MIDNTWATPLIYRPLEHGIDLAIYAGTKYQGGHSDLLIGSISANAATWPALKRLHRNLGIQAGTEEIWLTLRGLRTMGVRLERHERSALADRALAAGAARRWRGCSTLPSPTIPATRSGSAISAARPASSASC